MKKTKSASEIDSENQKFAEWIKGKAELDLRAARRNQKFLRSEHDLANAPTQSDSHIQKSHTTALENCVF